MQPFHGFCIYIHKVIQRIMKERLLNFVTIVIVWLIVFFLSSNM